MCQIVIISHDSTQFRKLNTAPLLGKSEMSFSFEWDLKPIFVDPGPRLKIDICFNFHESLCYLKTVL